MPDDAEEIKKLIQNGITSWQIATVIAAGPLPFAGMTIDELAKSMREMTRRMDDLKRETAIQRLLERERERCARCIESLPGHDEGSYIRDAAAAIRALQ